MDEVQPKLFLNMIVGDYEPLNLVKRAIHSIQPFVDDVYITVTYTDIAQDTPLTAYLKKEGFHVSSFQWIDDFAAARNFAMNAVPKGPNNFLVWIDSDDVFQNPQVLRQMVRDMVTLNQAAVFLNYLYMVELDENENIREIIIEHKRERLIRNDDTFKWIGMLHEILIEQRQENIQKVFRSECAVVHLSDPKRVDANLERNIRILESQAKKEVHRDPRTVIYLAKAYFDKSKGCPPAEQKININLALSLFQEYLEGEGNLALQSYREGSGWPEERSTAWSYVSEIFKMTGKLDEAIEAIGYAIDEAPQFPNYYIDLSALYVIKKDIPKAKHWLSVATGVEMPQTTIITLPRDLKGKALETDYHIALAEGRLDVAVKDLEMLVTIFTNIPAFAERLQLVRSMRDANKAAQSIVYLGKYLEKEKQEMKMVNLVRAIPDDLRNEKFASEMAHQFLPKRVWGTKEIAILCGPGFEEWTPESIQTGLGGSEEAVVYLSGALAKLGWQVTVYANPGAKAGNFNGVEYKMWWDINQKDDFNILILWRAIGFADFKPNSKFTLLWMHDVPNNPDFTQERIARVEKIAVLSAYHRSLFRMQKADGSFVAIPEEKFILTGNGIPDLSAFSEWHGDPQEMIYASSPDRGLIYLLTHWSEIRTRVPGATLQVYYGFSVFDAMFATNPGRMAWKKKIMQLLEQPGITYHGRVGHDALAKAYNHAGIWVYPTNFQEISCISAMKAQALGAVPVVTNYAALQETVKNGLKVDTDITTQKGQEEYVQALVDLLEHPERQAEFRTGMMRWAQQQFAWESVAKDWHGVFTKALI